MAHAHIGFDICGFRGRLGDFVYKRYGDKTVVTRVPRFKSWSKKQRDGRIGFAAASAYAVKAKADPELRLIYARWAEKRGLTMRSAAISDFLRPPDLWAIHTWHFHGRRGDRIVVCSRERYKLAALTVVIRDPAGRVLEEGPARSDGSDGWDYDVTQDLPGRSRVLIEATGTDRFGRQAMLSVKMEVP